MFVTRLILTNWRNFLEVNIPLHRHTYFLGANASGKSNLLDVFRFLRDICKPQGGGLQKALSDRGGIKKLRCLHARKTPAVRIEVHLSNSPDEPNPVWQYILAFTAEKNGKRRTLISEEEVFHNGKKIFSRPNYEDEKDLARLTQTGLEQIQINNKFRDIADFFGEITYLHLVPQLLKYGDLIGGQRIEDDPFGQGFLDRIAQTAEKTRERRLNKIAKALTATIPYFKELRFEQDKFNGRPHLTARYMHHRPNAGLQREDQFSDGTLRLIALLWVLQEDDSLLLLEEPELSLNNSIVTEIPLLFKSIQQSQKKARQIFVSTHSEALLSNPGINPEGVLIIEPVDEGSNIRTVNSQEKKLLRDGFSVGEVLLPRTYSKNTGQLTLWDE